MAIVKYVIESALNPFFLAMLLFACLLIWLYQQKSSRKVFWGFFPVFILFLAASTPWVARTTTFALEKQYPVINHPDIPAEWIVVLGGGQSDLDNAPANSLLFNASISRLVEGVRLYRLLPGAKLILSGGGSSTGQSEASHMAILAHSFLVPVSDLVLESESLNTASQAKNIKKILGAQPFYLVTSAIHMPRAMMLCRAESLNPIAAPTDFTLYWNDRIWIKRFFPTPYNMAYLSIALHELLGIGWSNMSGTP